ncbi:hypothetical protein Syun_008419 [Stephania yunnanensis]|uniref:Uncharacterized protein n=1 Tax=Stephania yunnanensis TaxID=152371 RepID=A0AAP0KDR1_9MAGN
MESQSISPPTAQPPLESKHGGLVVGPNPNRFLPQLFPTQHQPDMSSALPVRQSITYLKVGNFCASFVWEF